MSTVSIQQPLWQKEIWLSGDELWNCKLHLHPGSHPRWWHSAPSRLLPGGRHSWVVHVGLGQMHMQKVHYSFWILKWSSHSSLAPRCLLWHASFHCGHGYGMMNHIKIHVHPPTGAQVRGYVALRGRHPSVAQAQIPSGEVVCQSPPSEPQQSQLQFHLAIRDLRCCPTQGNVGWNPAGKSQEGGDGIPNYGSPLVWWHGPVGGADADLDEWGSDLFKGKGEGDLASWYSGTQGPPQDRGGYWSPSQHTPSLDYRLGIPEN